jgi:hypothetical protein
MAGLVPAIHAPGLSIPPIVQLMARGHVLKQAREDVDARHKAGHDGFEVVALPASGER